MQEDELFAESQRPLWSVTQMNIYMFPPHLRGHVDCIATHFCVGGGEVE